MEFALNQWHQLVSKTSDGYETSGDSGRPALCFWPDQDETVDFELEIHGLSVFGRKKQHHEHEYPAKIYVKEEVFGALSLCIVGRAGKPATVRQRFPWAVDAAKLARVENPEQTDSSDSSVEKKRPDVIRYFSEAQILEIEIAEMPPPPSAQSREFISRSFPKINRWVNPTESSVVLFTLQRGEN